MKRMKTLAVLLFALLLTGCSWLEGRYVSVERYEMPHQAVQEDVIAASDPPGLMEALESLIESGSQKAVIGVAEYPAAELDSGMNAAIRYAQEQYPLGSYAVEAIHYEHGTSSGQPALAVEISYRHSLTELLQIRKVRDMTGAETAVKEALNKFSANVVLHIEEYREKDFTQMVEDYGWENPQLVMEIPQVTESVFGMGRARVVELNFTYQNSRESLRQMQNQVSPVFGAATVYVSGDGGARQKYSQLYAFLMERFDYTMETSITPSYSLLRHGVGDSKAFATVYAAMCRQAGLECRVVTGTRSGEPWSWNMVRDEGYDYHVDLLRSYELGYYREYVDGEMQGYVWDYSAYPACTGTQAPEETAALTEPSPETLPEK